MDFDSAIEKQIQHPIPRGWHETTLGELVTFHRGYDLPLKDKVEGRYPIIGSNGIIGYHNSFKIKGPGVVVGRSGNLGKPFFVEKDYWPHNTSLYVSKFHCSDPYFVYYFLKTLSLSEFNSGSAVPSLNRNHIHTIVIVVPKEIEEQKAIGRILSRLDSRIELNKQLNKVLEAVGEAVFNRWFVDFDFPNEEGKPYKSSGGEMTISKEVVKEIPKGWKVGTLRDLAKLNPETWSKNTFPHEITYIDLSNTKWGKIEETQRYLWQDAPSRAQRTLRPGDTVIGTVRPGNGSYAFISDEGLTGSTGFAVLRPFKTIYEEFVYLVAASSDNIKRLSHLADGAAYPAVQPEVVLTTLTLIPEDALVERFKNIAKPIMAKMSNNHKESRVLAMLRDTLLPKLISGKIRVPIDHKMERQ